MRYLYTLLLTLAMPFVMLRLLWRARKIRGYRQRWPERWGYIPSVANKSIWVHAVSVGEVFCATPLIKALLKRYCDDYTLVVTTTTPTGSKQILKNFKDQVHHIYCPMDLPWIINRFLNRCHPVLFIIMETELWPNLLHYTHARNIPIVLANARLSQKSSRRYQYIRKLTCEMLSNISLVAAQSEMDGKRFLKLGLDRQKLLVTGNIKFDLELPESLLEEGKQLRSQWGNRPTIIAASTHEGEEVIILDSFKMIREKYADALLILVPRHPDRFEKVAKLCQFENFKIVQRSLKQLPDEHTNILLGDTMGELRLLYAASDIAFVGGSLVPAGGHNLIEPAALSLPILTGHHLHNFIAISQSLKDADAIIVVNNEKMIAEAVAKLLNDKSLSVTMGKRAHNVSTTNTGALERHLQWIDNHFSVTH